MKSYYRILLDTLTATYFVKTCAGNIIGMNFATRTDAKNFIKNYEKELN